MSRRRAEISLLIALGVVLVAAFYYSTRNGAPGSSGVLAEDTGFRPLDVQEPRLHIDRLEKLHRLEFSGPHRNIFVAAPVAPLEGPGQHASKLPEPFVGPRQPPPPPPLRIPAEFFGYATRGTGGRRVAFFTSGEDVLVVAEGDTFLGRFRLVHIGNDTADVEEIGTGRHSTVPMMEPPSEPAGTP